MVKRLKIPKELPEAVIPRRTDNTMVKRLKIPKELPEVVIPRRTDTKGVTRSRNSKKDRQYNGQTIPKELKIPKKIPKELPEAVIPRRTAIQWSNA